MYRESYESELAALREGLLFMGAKVEEMLEGAQAALEQGDVALARRLIACDEEVDRLEVELDERCVHLLACRQPVASDLRLITTALKVITQLERIADRVVDISREVTQLDGVHAVELWPSLKVLGRTATRMVGDALDAFTSKNAVLARQVIERDREVDAYYVQGFPRLMRLAMEDVSRVQTLIHLQSVAKGWERIGDKATNIAELVVFMVNGRQVRHALSVNLGRGPRPLRRRTPDN